MKKRVWCLYRVSTKRQVHTNDDIPLQRKSCHEFVKKKEDWEICKEMYERGVSGWSKSVNERDELLIIQEAAVKKELDVLLVFMFDRIGRRDDETPFIIKFLVNEGVEVWSVQEGQRKVDSHTDQLINYIYAWQSAGESIKTSVRVRETKKLLTEEGINPGGPAPYGYCYVDTHQPHAKKSSQFLTELIPVEEESEVVKLIFSLYADKHYGYRKIVNYLRDHGYRSRDQKIFGISSIKRLLDNPIYIGRRRYESFAGKKGDTMPYNPKLQIIPDGIFEKVKKIREQRVNALQYQDKKGIPLLGKLLFSGLAYCKYCGSLLSGNYLYRTYKRPDGEKYQRIVYRYRCPMNKGKGGHLQNIWGAKKYDDLIIREVKEILTLLPIDRFIEKPAEKKKNILQSKEQALKNLEKEKNHLKIQLHTLTVEIALSLSDESMFTPEQLANAIQMSEKSLQNITGRIEKIRSEIEAERQKDFKFYSLENELINWENKFDQADDDLKKAMLTRVIDKVEFGKETVAISFHFYLEELLKINNGAV